MCWFFIEGAECSCRCVFGNERGKVTIDDPVEECEQLWEFVEWQDGQKSALVALKAVEAQRQGMTHTYLLSIQELIY